MLCTTTPITMAALRTLARVSRTRTGLTSPAILTRPARHVHQSAPTPPADRPSRSTDPYPLPLSDPSLAALARSTPNLDKLDEPLPGQMPTPLDRTGEDEDTLRARLVYQTRKRGTLETDLILGTFAKEYLGQMSVEELKEFDKVRRGCFSAADVRVLTQGLDLRQLLDEPDWDIYYWSIEKREPPPRWKDTPLLEA